MPTSFTPRLLHREATADFCTLALVQKTWSTGLRQFTTSVNIWLRNWLVWVSGNYTIDIEQIKDKDQVCVVVKD